MDNLIYKVIGSEINCVLHTGSSDKLPRICENNNALNNYLKVDNIF